MKNKECFKVRLIEKKLKMCKRCPKDKVCSVAYKIISQINESKEKMEVGQKLTFTIKDSSGSPLNLEWIKPEEERSA